ncbi:bifunctional diguanylate cyclase/phosphodiesterase [Accumulibacter sp.]|uniref:sensor domain-containing protein n=1 Tax=Accumulibacter sp. TaxID=2053492 RepID=UPI0026180BEA|nr:PAS domain S-box protein [Accumulibacter sp.]
MSTEEKKDATEAPRSPASAPVPEPGLAELHGAPSPESLQWTLHELRVQRMALDRQNEELRRAQAEIEASREQYRQLYDLAPAGYLTLSRQGLIRKANLTCASLLGVPRDLLIDQPFARFILNDDQVIYYLYRKRLLAAGESPACELRMVKQGGDTFWARVDATSARDDADAAVFRVMISDISDRKQSEVRLQLAACVFSHAREGIMITAADGTIVEVNRAFTRITGYSREEAMARNSRFLASERQDKAFYAARRRALNEDGYWSGEVWNRRKNGELYVEMQTVSTVPDVQGKIRQVVTLFSDITTIKQAEEALAASEEQRRLFIEYAPAGLAMFDRDMRYLYASNRWFADHGLEKRDLQGLSHYDVFPELPEEWKEAHRRGLAGEELRSEGDRFERLDGSVKWVRWEIHPWYDAQRSVGGIVIFTEDITANKQAEAALRASEERLSLVLRGTRDAFWDWDLGRGEVYYSPRWWDMLGYVDDELVFDTKLWQRLTHPDDVQRVRQVFGAALADGADSCKVEFRLRHRDGHYLHTICRAMILRDENGKAIRVAGANTDITVRRQTEDALREQEAFFRLIAENLEGFLAVLDVDGRRIYNNPSYARLVGDRKLPGTSSFADIHADDRERVMQSFRDTVATGVGQHLEYRFVTSDGRVRVMESRGGAIKDSEGRTKRVVVLSHDVTERREAEERIRHLAFHDTLTQLPNRLTLLDRLRQTLAASKRTGCQGALMFVDLDEFKAMNDTYGHEAGDLLLIEVAHRLKACVREMDTVARFAGDEFVVMLSALDSGSAQSTSQARIVAEKIRLSLSQPYRLSIRDEGTATRAIEHRCTVSVGVALFTGHEGDADDILQRADAAMYDAKEAGRNLIRFHDRLA